MSPRVVLMPGLDGTGELFAPFLEALPATLDVSVVRYPHEACTIGDCADAALGQIPEGDLVLVAESFSGPVVTRLHPLSSRVAGVVFCATFLRPPRRLLLGLARLLPVAGLVSVAPLGLAARVCLGRDASPELVGLFRETVAAVPSETHAARVAELGRLDATGELDWLAERPALYLRAAHDRLVPESALGPFREHLLRLNVHEVEGHHLLLQSNPASCARIVAEFVDGLV